MRLVLCGLGAALGLAACAPVPVDYGYGYGYGYGYPAGYGSNYGYAPGYAPYVGGYEPGAAYVAPPALGEVVIGGGRGWSDRRDDGDRRFDNRGWARPPAQAGRFAEERQDRGRQPGPPPGRIVAPPAPNAPPPPNGGAALQQWQRTYLNGSANATSESK